MSDLLPFCTHFTSAFLQFLSLQLFIRTFFLPLLAKHAKSANVLPHTVMFQLILSAATENNIVVACYVDSLLNLTNVKKTMLQVLFEVLCFMCQPGCLLRLTLGINCCLEQSLISCCSKWERLDTSAPWTEHAVVRVALKALACHIRPYHDKVAMLRLIQATIVGEDFMGSFFVIIIGCISAQVFRVSKSMSC